MVLLYSFSASFNDKHFFLKATTKNTHIVLHDKHEASHDKEKSYTLQTHINTDLEDYRTLLHRTKLTYIHTHTIHTYHTFNFLQII